MSGIWGQGVARSPQGDAVSVGHFTHFAFTVNFTHYVKTKPDSGFTVKSRTLAPELPLCARTDWTHHTVDTSLTYIFEGEEHCNIRTQSHTHTHTPTYGASTQTTLAAGHTRHTDSVGLSYRSRSPS